MISIEQAIKLLMRHEEDLIKAHEKNPRTPLLIALSLRRDGTTTASVSLCTDLKDLKVNSDLRTVLERQLTSAKELARRLPVFPVAYRVLDPKGAATVGVLCLMEDLPEITAPGSQAAN
jgi:hypothetical protein